MRIRTLNAGLRNGKKFTAWSGPLRVTLSSPGALRSLEITQNSARLPLPPSRPSIALKVLENLPMMFGKALGHRALWRNLMARLTS